MRLEVRLFAGLKCNNQELASYGQNEFFIEVPAGTTVGELHAIMRIEPKDAKVNMVNGLAQDHQWVLTEGDRVGIFPPVGGG